MAHRALLGQRTPETSNGLSSSSNPSVVQPLFPQRCTKASADSTGYRIRNKDSGEQCKTPYYILRLSEQYEPNTPSPFDDPPSKRSPRPEPRYAPEQMRRTSAPLGASCPVMKISCIVTQVRKALGHLQDVSSEAEETGKASGGASSGAVSSTGESWLGWAWGDGADWSLGWLNWGWSWGLNWSGGVDVDWSSWDSWMLNWLGDGAWAVGDGQGGGLGHGVGRFSNSDLSWLWTPGDDLGNNFSCPRDIASGSRHGSDDRSGGSGVRELHFGGLVLLKK